MTTDVFQGRLANLEDLRGIVAASLGPQEVLAIVNGGDGALVQGDLDRLRQDLFRRDGEVSVFAHEERTRRGQLLGLLDALRARRERWGPLPEDGVALGIMMPGKGTRLSPLTQRLYGIKPFLPTLIRPSVASDGFLHGAGASLWTWTLVAHHLERMGFCGIAWKWGDEPQIPANVFRDLDLDLEACDAVRFGARTRVTEDLARNKEWLFADETGTLVKQVRRRGRDALLRAFGIDNPSEDTHALVHVGSPAFSHLFLEVAEEVFGRLDGWLDVDGYLFEALTHDPVAWQEEVESDPGLRAMLETCPDFYERVRRLAQTIRRRRGHAPVVKVVDLGEGLYWGDFGQLDKARRSLLQVRAGGDEERFARYLAALEDVEPDTHGNVRAGDTRIPEDGRVRNAVLVDAWIGDDCRVDGAVIVASEIRRGSVAEGAVVVESTALDLVAEASSFVFRAVGETVRVASGWVHTDIPVDPAAVDLGLQPWRADMGKDIGSTRYQDLPAFGNPTSFAEKFRQVRERHARPDAVERAVETRFRAPLQARARRPR